MDKEQEQLFQPPEIKKQKTEFCSDNSASLPGMVGDTGPVGFEPGMFKQEDENSTGATGPGSGGGGGSKSKSDSGQKVKQYKIFLNKIMKIDDTFSRKRKKKIKRSINISTSINIIKIN